MRLCLPALLTVCVLHGGHQEVLREHDDVENPILRSDVEENVAETHVGPSPVTTGYRSPPSRRHTIPGRPEGNYGEVLSTGPLDRP